MRPRVLVVVLVGAFLLAATGCGPTGEPADGGEAPDAGDELDAGVDAGATPTLLSVTIEPASLTLDIGATAGLHATAHYSDGSSTEVSGQASWSVAPPALADVQIQSVAGNIVMLQARSAGQAEVRASHAGVSAASVSLTVRPATPDAGVLPTELRAVWVTRFSYHSANEVRSIIDRAADAGFNVVFFQIRGNGDAYYKSSLVPWAQNLSGTLGKDPGWDPLRVAIDQAHLRGMQLHAYWNVFSAWLVPQGCSGSACACQPAQGQSNSCVLPPATASGPQHALRSHPDWMAVDSTGKSIDTEYYWFAPGNPDVRNHLVAVAAELLSTYDVDGLHLDRVRYPGPQYSYDPASQAAFNALPAPRPSHEDWQRSMVTDTVSRIYSAVRQYRPNAMLSAAVWGIYKLGAGCSTSNGYGDYFQDSVGWVQNAQIDALVPMMYWDIGTGCTDWAKLLDYFMAYRNGRFVVAGMSAYDGSVTRPDRLRARVNYARQVGAAGTAIFASVYLDTTPAGADGGTTWSTFRADGGLYAQDAQVPAVTWR